jgi:hypothetical protein
MPFHGFNRCGRCRKELRIQRETGANIHAGTYHESQLKLEIIVPNPQYPDDKHLRVTCPKGHTYVSKSYYAHDYIRRHNTTQQKEKR